MASVYDIQEKDGTYSLVVKPTSYTLNADHCQIDKRGNLHGSFAVHNGTGPVFAGKAALLGTTEGCAKLIDRLVAYNITAIPGDALLAFGTGIRKLIGSAPLTPTSRAGMPMPATAYTDLANAERLVARHGADLRFCHIWGKWLVWNGQHWRIDDTAEIERRGKEATRAIYFEVGRTTDDEVRRALLTHARQSEQRSRLEAMIALAASESGIPIRTDQLDANPWLLTVANGTLDLRTGTLKAADRADYVTKLAPVSYDPDAKCPTFLAFLERIFEGDATVIKFIQKAVGYSLSGDTSERCLFILHGGGRNGKSTLLQVLLALLGDYGLRTPTSTLLAKHYDVVPNDIARLQGVRLVVASETDQGRQLAEALVKDLTGQDTLSARYMRAEWFDFVPVCKIWLGTNHRPEIRGTDKAIWDRVRLIPFNVRIPDATDTSVPEDQRADPLLLGKLKAELPGILAWAVEGCNLWQRERLGWPTAIREATERYRADMDLIGDFLAECCVIDKFASVPVGKLYEQYQTWATESGEKPQNKRVFGQAVSERGFGQDKKGKGRRHWEGIGLTTDTEDLIGGVGGKGGRPNGINKAAQNYAGAIPKTTPLMPPVPPNAFVCRTCSGTRSWGRPTGELVCTDCGAMLPLFSAGDWVRPSERVKDPTWARAQVVGDAVQHPYQFKRLVQKDGSDLFVDENWMMWWYQVEGSTVRFPEIDLERADPPEAE